MDLKGIGEEPSQRPTKLEILNSNGRKALEMRKKRALAAARGIDPQGTKTTPARQIARKLVEDPVYQRRLQNRLRKGIAGPIEIWLWRYAFGEPAKNEEEKRLELEKYEAVRAQVKEFLKLAPARAAILDVAVQRAPRVLLPLPQMPESEDDGNASA